MLAICQDCAPDASVLQQEEEPATKQKNMQNPAVSLSATNSTQKIHNVT